MRSMAARGRRLAGRARMSASGPHRRKGAVEPHGLRGSLRDQNRDADASLATPLQHAHESLELTRLRKRCARREIATNRREILDVGILNDELRMQIALLELEREQSPAGEHRE